EGRVRVNSAYQS
nr:Chain H, Aggrecan core peptide [Homo sapiens]